MCLFKLSSAMTTVSLLDFTLSAPLRTSGSSLSSTVFKRRSQCVTPESGYVPAYRRKYGSLHDAARSPQLDELRSALVSSPLQSPEPRNLSSAYSRCATSNTIAQSVDLPSEDDSDEDETKDSTQFWHESQDFPDKLIVVGSNPRVTDSIESLENNDVEIKQSQSVPGSSLGNEGTNEESHHSPRNPPPSPVNFNPSLDGFVVGGHKLTYPDRHSEYYQWCRDFNPGFVRQPIYQCEKCECKMKDTEQTQVVLNRRLSLIMNRRSCHHGNHDNKMPHSAIPSKASFYDYSEIKETNHDQLYHQEKDVSPTPHDINSAKIRERQDRDRERKRERERRREYIRYKEKARLIEKIENKERRSQSLLIQNDIQRKLDYATRQKVQMRLRTHGQSKRRLEDRCLSEGRKTKKLLPPACRPDTPNEHTVSDSVTTTNKQRVFPPINKVERTLKQEQVTLQQHTRRSHSDIWPISGINSPKIVANPSSEHLEVKTHHSETNVPIRIPSETQPLDVEHTDSDVSLASDASSAETYDEAEAPETPSLAGVHDVSPTEHGSEETHVKYVNSLENTPTQDPIE